jgi:hypothetical protein
MIGSRANGLGYASSCLSDAWSTFNNPAGLSNPENTSVNVTYDVFSNFKTFNRYAATFHFPFLGGGSGIGIMRFGDELYNEQQIRIAYANQLGITSLGASCQYIQYRAEGIGTKGIVTFSLGGITKLTDWLRTGAYIVNVTQPKVAENEKIPTLLILGVSVKASEKVFLFLEVEKNINEEPVLKSAVEYQINKKFAFRTGIHPAPASGFFGFSIQHKKLKLDYAFSYLPAIGTRHQTTLAYKISSK